jgi:hypothetical protein
MKTPVNQYKITKMASQMAKEFGQIKKGAEEQYELLQYMEVNMLKIHYQNPKCTSPRAQEAIHICLMKIDGYINGVEYDLGNYVNPENNMLAEAILLSFDPFSNNEIYDIAGKTYQLETKEGLREYFTKPVKCLLRIVSSVEMWMKEMGADGYFRFLDDQIGSFVAHDDKMGYFIDTKN